MGKKRRATKDVESSEEENIALVADQEIYHSREERKRDKVCAENRNSVDFFSTLSSHTKELTFVAQLNSQGMAYFSFFLN